MQITSSLDKTTYGKIKRFCKKVDKKVKEGETEEKLIKDYIINIDDNLENIADSFFGFTPTIRLFNDFSALLPDKILLEKIDDKKAEGYSAVKNLEKLLNRDFKNIANKADRQRRSASDKESEIISANFQNDWQQKIYGNNNVKIIFEIQNNENAKKEIIFSVVTKDNENLAPRKRSKGMIWFLSLWLELKAKEKDDSLVLLFDEPGLHLHIKANKDMLKVFHNLVNKGHQIIYSTHSPSLIETDKLHNIGLVINSQKEGTLVEGLTTAKINSENKKDALQPIAEAMGLEPLKDFTILKEKNVIVEGLSDFWIFKSFIKILNKKIDYEFIPGVGIKGNQIKPLISFSIGYGLDWVLVMDNGALPNKIKTELHETIFLKDEKETNNKIKLINKDEIENLFDITDLPKINSTYKIEGNNANKKPIEIIGKDNKILFSKQFFTKAINNEFKKSDFNESTIQEFERIFTWIEKKFNK